MRQSSLGKGVRGEACAIYGGVSSWLGAQTRWVSAEAMIPVPTRWLQPHNSKDQSLGGNAKVMNPVIALPFSFVISVETLRSTGATGRFFHI